MMLAAASPDPQALYQTLVIFQFLGGLLLVGAQVVLLLRTNRAQKREVTFGFEAASGKEFAEHVRSNDRMFEQLARDATERRRAIYAKLDETEKTLSREIMSVREHVAGLEERSELLNQRVVQMDQKLDRAIERKR